MLKRFAVALAFLTLVVWACQPAQNYLDPNGPKFTGQYAPNPPVFKDTLRVVTFNIKYSEKVGRAIQELRTLPDLRNADLLLLQEMDEQGVDQIARALGYNYVYYPATRHPRTGRNFGNAVLSKWPIRTSRKVLLPHAVMGLKTRRIAVYATVRVEGQDLLVGSIHTATIWLPYDQRMAQVDSALRSLPQPVSLAVIGGDFNTLELKSLRDVERLFTRHGLTLATRHVGPTARLGPIARKLDHVFVTGFEVLAAGVVWHSRASDHVPVWVVLRFPPKRHSQSGAALLQPNHQGHRKERIQFLQRHEHRLAGGAAVRRE